MITLDGEVWPVAGVDRMEVWRNGEPMPMELDKVIVYGTDYIRDTSTYIQLSPKARSAVYALVHGNQRPATDTLQELCRAECSRIVRDSGRNASRALIRELVQGVLAAADGVDSSDRSDMDELAKGIDEGYRLEQESATSSGCAESILHIMDMHASVSTLYFGISDVAQDWKAEVFSLKVPRDCWVGLADYWDSIASTRLVEHWAGGYRFIELGRVVRDYACMMAGDRVNSAAEWRTYCQK
jgi:hypothetical protein